MSDAPTPTYLKARELHNEIESLYPLVEQHRAWFRGKSFVGKNVPLPTGRIPVVDLDRVYCALAIKAATTKRAVLSLCESGDRDWHSVHLSTPGENLTVPPIENLTDRRGDEPQVVAAS